MRKLPGLKDVPFKYALMAAFVFMQIWLIFLKRHETMILAVWPNVAPSPRIFGGQIIGQTFVCGTSDLSRIDIQVAVYGLSLKTDILFSLWELAPVKKLILEQTLKGPALVDNRYFPVKFDRIHDSKGKTYVFVLAAPDTTPDASASVWMTQHNTYRGGSFLFNGKPARGDIVFRLYAERPVSGELGRINGKLPGFLSSRAIMIFALFFFELVQIAMLWMLLNWLFPGKEPAPCCPRRQEQGKEKER
jgi:hypothetical protein